MCAKNTNHDSTSIAVIPARYQSERFPGKPLAKIAGKPMIQWVYEAADNSLVSRTLVATDNDEILQCVHAFGGNAVMTSSNHSTGTDRIAEAVEGLDADLVINLQGDEPLIPSAVIDDLINDMLSRADAQMGTIAVPICPNGTDYTDPNVVKVVVDNHNYALYFSRASIPFYRNGDQSRFIPLKHWGIYAYKMDFLRTFVSWPQGKLECSENLEQLRAIENGTSISVIIRSEDTIGVDVPEDIQKVEEKLAYE